MKNTWIFYGESKEGVRTLHFIKECKQPERTKEYKEMMQFLEISKYYITGHMTSKAWNKNNQYIKIV